MIRYHHVVGGAIASIALGAIQSSVSIRATVEGFETATNDAALQRWRTSGISLSDEWLIAGLSGLRRSSKFVQVDSLSNGLGCRAKLFPEPTDDSLLIE